LTTLGPFLASHLDIRWQPVSAGWADRTRLGGDKSTSQY